MLKMPTDWHQTCQQQFLDNNTTQIEIRSYFVDQDSVVSNNFFSTYCAVFV